MRSFYALFAVSLVISFQARSFAGQNAMRKREPGMGDPVFIMVNGATFKEVLSRITQQTAVRFSYASDIFPANRTVNVDLHSQPLKVALDKILNPVDITWVPVRNDLIVLAKKSDPPEKAGTIHGVISDAVTGEALPGATVLLKGTSLGASTDLNGSYSIFNVPQGSYTLRVSYVGYRTKQIRVWVGSGEKLVEDVKLEAVGVKGKTVVVTAQARGQNAAINQQLASHNIVNVVSAARIQSLPDENAAESVGRLPGVYLLRSGGEGDEVSIRGLAPQYNVMEIDGVPMAATSSSNSSVDISNISSNLLGGIELYKTVTPDMDAAVLGGVVNFQIQEARRTKSGAPEIELSTQGGYGNLTNSYNNYKFTAAVGDRFFNNRFGILVNGVVEGVDLTDDKLGTSYELRQTPPSATDPLLLDDLTLTFNPRYRHRYGATVSMDYRLPEGKIDFVNFFSTGVTQTQSRSQEYDLVNSQIYDNLSYSQNTLNSMVDLIDFKQTLSPFMLDVKLSNSYSENITPLSWDVKFLQSAVGFPQALRSLGSPDLIAAAGDSITNPNKLVAYNLGSGDSFGRQRNLTGSVDLTTNFALSDLISGSIKFGGMYRYTLKDYQSSDLGGANLYNPGAGNVAIRSAVLNNYPWMTQPPYNLNPSGVEQIPVTLFEDPAFSYGNFLGGAYAMGPALDMGLLNQMRKFIISYEESPHQLQFQPISELSQIQSNYTGHENEDAGYIMATLKLGPQVTLIPGVRYQGLQTTYTAPYIPSAEAANTYPYPFPHTDTTVTRFHGYWLPDVNFRYDPLTWFGIRASYTNTLHYPGFTHITPLIELFTGKVTYHNIDLKPARSQNFDLEFSFYDNSIGLLTVDGFLKRINDFIFGESIYTSDPAQFGLPARTNGWEINTELNDPYTVNDWGTELDWQTNFWYLPGVLRGLVFDVNYTHIFSSAKYPLTVTSVEGYPPQTVHTVTFYSDRLIDQPDNVVNLSIGWDYKGFSALVSMIYQANVSSGYNFWPQLRVDKAKYERWDAVFRQKLPVPGLQAYLNLNNLNDASDIYIVRGGGFPNSESDYGSTASLGLKWNLQ